MDHVVPISLYRTWSANALVLACQSCNHVKADRLPLSFALLLVWSADFGRPTSSTGGGPDLALWRLLARLAHTKESVDRWPDSGPLRLTSDLPEQRFCARLCPAGKAAA